MQPRDFLADDMQPQSSQQFAPRDFLAEAQPRQESLGESALFAAPRVAEDVYKGLFSFLKNIPEHWKTAKTEFPGLISALQNNPKHAGSQALAGMSELGQNVFNAPHDLANYATERLHLLPENINQHIQMARMPEDTQGMINQAFGQPEQAGESLIRGTMRNLPNIVGAGALASALNPLKLTNKNIAKSIINEGDRQVSVHNKLYENLWKDAQKAGINKVNVNPNVIEMNFEDIKKYKSPRDYRSLQRFVHSNTLENAQTAVSDLKAMKRSLEEKSRTSSLSGEERRLYDSLQNTEEHIENNMFKDSKGNLNEALANRYRGITNSYRENVVPYRYNKDIQAFKNQELVAKQLAERLRIGEFGAKKGSQHPELYRSEALKKALLGLSAIGGIHGGLTLKQYLTGSNN